MLTHFLRRLVMNYWPCYHGTGGRVTYIAPDWSEIRIKLPLSWRTRNYVGTIYGGSLYGAVDPIYMLILIKLLGPDYIVWDKAATIRFRRPGRTTLYATFKLPDGELAAIRAALKTAASIERTYTVDLIDASGQPHATIEKLLYIKLKKPTAPAQNAP